MAPVHGCHQISPETRVFCQIQELGPPPKRKKGPNSSPEEKAERDPPPHSSDEQPSDPTISTGNTPQSNTTQDSTRAPPLS
ncbi:hypothetical protein PCASD_08431 [Puccinia coronata f. sp. avenae]|uniref:Uncharacterized protein n=1 Tax=Puccinia coronata f. sp. avenae TaxID=200324 RepID=A0A2N5UML9_9BASI|nr:hypothetical protein PCASD_08431 [Puccinia coronata f. sp. avenae]